MPVSEEQDIQILRDLLAVIHYRKDGDFHNYRSRIDELEIQASGELDKCYYDKKLDLLLASIGKSGSFAVSAYADMEET